jgi:hypothetical protein
MESQHYAAGAYFSLLLVLVFFITFSAILIYLLSKELKRSLRREEEGSVFSRAVLLVQEDERARANSLAEAKNFIEMNKKIFLPLSYLTFC